MRKLMLGAVLAALAFPAASHAQYVLDLRVGFAPAMGDAAKDVKLNDVISSQIPVQVGAAYKVTPEVAVGAYFSYGIGQAKLDMGGQDLCSVSGVDCSSRMYRVGLQVAYTVTQLGGPFVPWASIGSGYEWANAKAKDSSGAQLNLFYTGWEYANVTIGGDYKVSPKLAVGPYAAVSIGKYSDGRLEDQNGLILGEGIPDQSVHEWLNFGIRGKFDL